MLFPYQPQSSLDLSAVRKQRENLKRFELDYFHRFAVEELILNRTLFCDHLLIDTWRRFGLDGDESLCLIAVGGYGRQEMFPLSDLDFLILTLEPASEETQRGIAAFIQFLWDCGFDVGSSVRTLQECESEGKKEITIATNLLECRYLFGNEDVFEQLLEMLQQPDFWPMPAFYQAKMAEKIQRYEHYHNTSYNLEPDLKYSPGGLRDLHLVYWIALRHSNARTLRQILQSRFIYPEEFDELLKSQQFLFKVRFALHLILKRYDNRLLFDRQVKVSEMLGYQGEGNRPVETMMRDFFRTLQTIGLVSDILTKHYREHYLQSSPIQLRQRLDDCFQLVDNSILLYRENGFIERPATIITLFHHLTTLPNVEIHSSTLRELHLALGQLNEFLSADPLARRQFLALLKQPNAVERALIPMHKYGVLTAYIPQWQGIEGLMQFDLFHSYTVDEHTLRVVRYLEGFLHEESGKTHPLCTALFPLLPNRSLIYIAALFHDIAKGRGGDHAELGAADIVPFALRHGFNATEVETMQWLVQAHLLMSITAQRRDIHDPEVVRQFAAAVKNKERLDYLLCLTVADICATNATLWNGWKRSLLTTLYQYTNRQFRQGTDMPLNNQVQEDIHKAQALEILAAQHFDRNIAALWARCPSDYFLRNQPKQLAWHATLLADCDDELLVKISNRFSSGGTEIFIYAKDRPNLFHRVVTTIGNKKFSIHDAQIITSLDGYVLDSFIITELDGSLLKFDRRRQLERALLETLQSDKELKPYGGINRKLQNFSVKTEVRFLNIEKTAHTEMELVALDSAGLLAHVSQIFTRLNLNLQNAKITTVGEKAEDFFILTNAQGIALSPAERDLLAQYIEREC
ncbi:bifunctional uridylyltransferase/uridylyl-removing protein GlnD [Pasteurellaceae bacterium LIM206]|nr:bifunctional uridylyltransferase/uridylyl-removing protein GlnD [Pasteurellaceae bacterium LIM206]